MIILQNMIMVKVKLLLVVVLNNRFVFNVSPFNENIEVINLFIISSRTSLQRYMILIMIIIFYGEL